MDIESVLVCVTEQYECERLIREGRKIADKENKSLYVIHVQPKGSIGKKFSKELEYLFNSSKRMDAEMMVFFANEPYTVIKNCIERYKVSSIVLGVSKQKTSLIPENLKSVKEDIKIYIIS